MPIRQLPSEVAAKIAAGEVVERPASVAKELIENALDAGARHVRVELAGGGLDLIRVTDDGRGIPADELSLAVARHATSKIGALDDLERIRTLGFRGEALASIASVAKVTLLSRPREESVGAQLTVDEGAVGKVTPAGAAVGTSVSVRGLFASVPARLKFLKSRPTESGHCLRLVEQYALAYPEVRFSVITEGRQALVTAGDGKLLSVITAVYGLSIAERMAPLGETSPNPLAPFPEKEGGVGSERPVVSGYVSRPSCYKATRQYLSFFVNRRWVQSRTLSFAVEEAYHSLLLAGRHPLAVINIALDPAQLDVNVHPAKTEVKFLRERQVYAAVQRAARAAVLANVETPEVSARSFAVPAWEALSALGSPSHFRGGGQGERLATEAAADAESDQGQAALFTNVAPGEPAPRGASGGFAVPGVEPDAPVGGKKLPALRVLGQVSQSYIITEGPDGVYMVDQHAAHERILLERMVEEWRARAVTSQLLLEPLPLELSPTEREAVEDHLEALRRIGFEIEPFGGDAMLVRAAPGILSELARSSSLRELVLQRAGAEAEAASHGETWEEHALANVACKAAIKAGQTLSPEEQRELIRQLEGVRAHQSCCHGRPTMVHLSLSALEREFDRR
jgi:DNA mismatch repair protein MutL